MTEHQGYIDKILATTAGKAKKKILIVENNRSFLGQLYKILMNHHFEVVTCTNINDALHKIERDIKIEVVIVNALLPNNRGIALLSTLKKSKRFNSLPVILTLDHGDADIVSQAISNGADGLILHPLTNENVMSKIRLSMARGKETVLIVDDDPVILELLQHIIEVKKFNVLATTNGEHALQILAAYPISVVISDVILPDGMSGYKLLEQVTTQHPHTPVILISGAGKTVGNRSGEAAYAYIKKPFNNVEILQTLRRAMQESKPQKETVKS